MEGTPALREMQGPGCLRAPGSLSDSPLVIWAEKPKDGASWMEESGSALLWHYPKMGLRGLGVVEEEALKARRLVVPLPSSEHRTGEYLRASKSSSIGNVKYYLIICNIVLLYY